MAEFVRLPVLIRCNVQTRQPAVAVGPGGDTHGSLQPEWYALPLVGVPANHRFAGAMRPMQLCTQRLPVQPVARLSIERKIRMQTSVNEDVGIGLIPVHTTIEEAPVTVGDVVKGHHPV